MMHLTRTALYGVMFCVAANIAFGHDANESIRAELDIPYADSENPRQRLDLLLPKQRNSDEPLPVIAFVHGGAWRNGDKRGGLRSIAPYVATGNYAAASIGYRLTDEATWPSQIHDCKAAIRWLRANAGKYNLDPEQIGVIGPSAGGHLVAMLGTSGDVEKLEGQLGKFPEVSSRVTCVVDEYGPTELLTMSKFPSRIKHDAADSPESKLVGGPLQERPDVARSASPITHVTKDDPPFLIIHGTDDALVPFNQSERLHSALDHVGVQSVFIKVENGGHGGFRNPELQNRIQAFFDRHLRGKDVTVSDDLKS